MIFKLLALLFRKPVDLDPPPPKKKKEKSFPDQRAETADNHAHKHTPTMYEYNDYEKKEKQNEKKKIKKIKKTKTELFYVEPLQTLHWQPDGKINHWEIKGPLTFLSSLSHAGKFLLS